MSFDWKDLIGNVAPALASSFGGPAAGLGVKMITDALGLKKSATEEDIYTALQTNPDAILKLKQAEYNFKESLAENGIKLEDIAVKDRDSARNREIQLKDKTPGILAASVTIGFFGTLFYMMQNGLPDYGGDAMLIMVGALGAAWGSVMNYYFGSSSGSKEKTELINNMKK